MVRMLEESEAQDNEGEAVEEEILEVLGEDPQKSKALDITLHESLKLCWNYWITHALEKKVKEELVEKYARSVEFEAPGLNTKIAATLQESAVKRDNFMVENQKLAGSALTAIELALTMIMTDEDIEKLVLVQRLNEAAKLIMSIHYNQTESRKAFIYPGIKLQFRDMLKNRKTDSFLFGSGLAEKIKESKNVQKLSQDVRNQPSLEATPKYESSKKNLNWKSLQERRPLDNRTDSDSNVSGSSSYIIQDQRTEELEGTNTAQIRVEEQEFSEILEVCTADFTHLEETF